MTSSEVCRSTISCRETVFFDSGMCLSVVKVLSCLQIYFCMPILAVFEKCILLCLCINSLRENCDFVLIKLP